MATGSFTKIQTQSSISSRERSLNNGRHKFNPHYFAWPNPFWIIIILFGLWLLTFSTFAPENIPSFLGPVGTFGKFMGHNHPNVCLFIFFVAVILHVGEALYALKVCLDREMTTFATFKWTFSTFAFGFSSLSQLPQKPNYMTRRSS